MAAIDVAGLLRPGLLDGVDLLVAGESTAQSTLGATVAEVCAGLGASVRCCVAVADDEAAIDAVAQDGETDMLVVDGAALFTQDPDAEAQGGDAEGQVGGTEGQVGCAPGPVGITPGHAALRACLDTSWNVTRAVINHAFLPREHGGRVVYLAPAPDAGELAEAARAGLENLARTLSIEWARHGVNVLCVAPGTDTTTGEVAALCAYLASPAGAYFSGCLLDLRGP
jgi:NAD(P)-dependent dehydrogenase (short-subunit alcohol dehydrogenase family)